jgi:hypothetical protein
MLCFGAPSPPDGASNPELSILAMISWVHKNQHGAFGRVSAVAQVCSTTRCQEANIPTFFHDTEKSAPSRARTITGRNGGTLAPFQPGEGQRVGYRTPSNYVETLNLARKSSPDAIPTLIKCLNDPDSRTAVAIGERPPHRLNPYRNRRYLCIPSGIMGGRPPFRQHSGFVELAGVLGDSDP